MKEQTVAKSKKHWTFLNFDSEGNRTYKVKHAFGTEEEAIETCFQINLKPQSIHKMVPYKCPVCLKWHIGHSDTVLDEKAREKIKKQYKTFKTIIKNF